MSRISSSYAAPTWLTPSPSTAPLGESALGAAPCGNWAFEALRIARGEPRFGLDTDHKTIPNEAGWIGTAVHLDKGCYRGQETVARVHTLGRPPRRLVLLHLDGSVDHLPDPRRPGPRSATKRWVASVQQPATSSSDRLRWRSSSATSIRAAVLQADGVPAAQEIIVDPGRWPARTIAALTAKAHRAVGRQTAPVSGLRS
ncbi:MAG: tRNA-modifying protein YgfZ [Nocardioidaceae bacterium]